MDISNVLTLAEAAILLEVPVARLRTHAATGRLVARRVGNAWITTRDAVEAYRSLDAADVKARPTKRPKTDMGAVGDDGQVFGG
ncbi:MAG: helix-turn-helix domain-containing protein [Chloroflexi bacterium]|nr:helix-turn-helix domain-containing protein [Chloroflexota bacterium]